jgi:acyl-CoA thioester hydrolase
LALGEQTAVLFLKAYEMRPKPFIPELLNHDKRYVKDKTDGLVWHKCKNRVLYADTDRSQIVYHANHLRFFELGRASMMRDAGRAYREIEEDGFIYPIIEVGVKYYAPLYYDDPMWIHTRPGKLERVRIQFDYIITHMESGDIVCKGYTKHCALNSSGRPVAIDQKTLELWKAFPE